MVDGQMRLNELRQLRPQEFGCGCRMQIVGARYHVPLFDWDANRSRGMVQYAPTAAYMCGHRNG
jgi:hypothetical protein